MIIGIDIGKSGGISVLDNGKIKELYSMPILNDRVDVHSLSNIILDNSPRVVVVEKVHARPGNGVKQAFDFGLSVGAIETLLVLRQIPHIFVPPQTWSSKVFIGMPKKEKGKKDEERAFYRVQQIWGSETATRFVPARCRKAHSGQVDAALIAWWYHEYG